MRNCFFLCCFCLLALVFPGAELQCWDTAGIRAGSWTEKFCDGKVYDGSWMGYVTSDCQLIGAAHWESVTGKIDPTSKVLTAAGAGRTECGFIEITGTFSHDLISVSGNYTYTRGGRGHFSGTIQH